MGIAAVAAAGGASGYSDSPWRQRERPRAYAWGYVRLQPLRKVGLMSLLASALLVIRIFSLSHSSFPSNRRARTPSEIHSVNGAATLKFEQAGSPPLQARIQSRLCPGDLVRNSLWK